MSSNETVLYDDLFIPRTSVGYAPEYIPEKKVADSGIKDYPLIDFDEAALKKLSDNVKNTLSSSDVRPGGGRIYRAVKRTFDIVCSLCGIAVLAIPMGIVSLLIYKEDKGNPIFSQVRLTKDGKTFNMYKFRSMCMDAEERFAEVQKTNQCDGLAFKMENDPRVTKIGRFLRKTSIDELPQLFNVFKGDMSLVGPRPERKTIMHEYEKELPEFYYRLKVKAGLTGYAQVYGKYNTTPYDKLKLDLFYIENYSFLLDIKLIFMTVKIFFQKEVSEGVDDRQVNALKDSGKEAGISENKTEE